MNEQRAGFFYAISAYLIWGTFPLYWRALVNVPPIELLAHRVVWSVVVMACVIGAGRRWHDVIAVLRCSRERWALLGSALLVTFNWGLYIWAVNAGHILDASLGYFMNPLFNVLLGCIFLGERLNRWQTSAVMLAAGGLLVQALSVGKAPWVAILLAVTFSLYGLIRKLVTADSACGLTVETIFMAPIAFSWLCYLQAKGQASFGHVAWWQSLLLAGAGIATAVPLLFFANAVRRLRYSTLGFIQYVSPTSQFLLAVFVFGETFSAPRIMAFGCVWFALVLFFWGTFREPA